MTMHLRPLRPASALTRLHWPAIVLALLVFTVVGAVARAATPDEAPAVVAAPTAGPSVVIGALQEHLLAYMTAAQADGGATPDAVETLHTQIVRTHDFPYIARIVLGRHWRALEDADRTAFTERFTALSLATYANRFAEFSGESFEITGEGESAFGQRSVQATLVTRGGEHTFEYLLRGSAEDGWHIVNIIVDGVSDLALKRAEYATLFADSGFDGLMQELDRQRRDLTDEG